MPTPVADQHVYRALFSRGETFRLLEPDSIARDIPYTATDRATAFGMPPVAIGAVITGAGAYLVSLWGVDFFTFGFTAIGAVWLARGLLMSMTSQRITLKPNSKHVEWTWRTGPFRGAANVPTSDCSLWIVEVELAIPLIGSRLKGYRWMVVVHSPERSIAVLSHPDLPAALGVVEALADVTGISVRRSRIVSHQKRAEFMMLFGMLPYFWRSRKLIESLD